MTSWNVITIIIVKRIIKVAGSAVVCVGKVRESKIKTCTFCNDVESRRWGILNLDWNNCGRIRRNHSTWFSENFVRKVRKTKKVMEESTSWPMPEILIGWKEIRGLRIVRPVRGLWLTWNLRRDASGGAEASATCCLVEPTLANSRRCSHAILSSEPSLWLNVKKKKQE